MLALESREQIRYSLLLKHRRVQLHQNSREKFFDEMYELVRQHLFNDRSGFQNDRSATLNYFSCLTTCTKFSTMKQTKT